MSDNPACILKEFAKQLRDELNAKTDSNEFWIDEVEFDAAIKALEKEVDANGKTNH